MTDHLKLLLEISQRSEDKRAWCQMTATEMKGQTPSASAIYTHLAEIRADIGVLARAILFNAQEVSRDKAKP